MARKYNYTPVKVLPKGAIKVSEFVKTIDGKGISTSLFYHRLERKVATYKIVVFQDINFVLP